MAGAWAFHAGYLGYTHSEYLINVKLKQSRYSPGVAQMVLGS